MAARTIETKAIFSATDQTGQTFAFIAKKIMGVDEAAKHAQSRIDAFNKANSRSVALSRNAEMAAATASRMTGLNSILATAATAITSGVVAHRVIQDGAKRMHERVRMEASGMAESEINEATALAAKLSSQFKPINQTDTMHMIRNARSIVGSYQEAAEIMEPLMKLRVIAQANRPGQDVSEDFDQLVKGLEIKGVTQHPEQFREYMEGIAKGLNVFGDTLKPYQYYEMFKYGRQATPGLSSDFILSTAPTLAQELGGSSYGNAVAGFNRAIVNGRMEHASLKELYRLGLANKDDLDFLKTGEVKGLKPGHHIQGWQLAQSDPNEWVKQYFLPALQKAGIAGADAIMQEVGVLFSNKMAAQMVDLLATQQSRIEKDRALIHNAPGMSAAERYMKDDFSIAMQGFHSQLENAAAAMGAPLAKALTPAVNAASEALALYARRVQENTMAMSNNPNEVSPSQKRFNRFMNNRVLGIDSDASVMDIPDSKIRDHDLAVRREELRRRIEEPKRLRHNQAESDAWKKEHPVWASLGFGGYYKGIPEIFDKDSVAAKSELDALDRATFARMVTEHQLDNVRHQMKASRELFYRVGEPSSPTIPGALAMPSTLDYRGVDVPTMSIGAHRPAAVAMPDHFAAAARQQVSVGFDPVKVEVSVRAEPSSSLLSIVADLKRQTAAARAFTNRPDTGPGGLGETSTDQ